MIWEPSLLTNPISVLWSQKNREVEPCLGSDTASLQELGMPPYVNALFLSLGAKGKDVIPEGKGRVVQSRVCCQLEDHPHPATSI